MNSAIGPRLGAPGCGVPGGRTTRSRVGRWVLSLCVLALAWGCVSGGGTVVVPPAPTVHAGCLVENATTMEPLVGTTCASAGCTGVPLSAQAGSCPTHGEPYALAGSQVALGTLHVDPSAWTLGDLARIRGAMWTAKASWPIGPEANRANIIATVFLSNYDSPTRRRMLEDLRLRGYTHVVLGPVVDSDGYHGIWAPTDWRTQWDRFLDLHQECWDAGLAPITFIRPDGWTLEQTQALTPFLEQRRAQQLLRIVVPTGWEPTKHGWSSQTWSAFARWARETLPNALVFIHTVADTDAPVGTDERGDDNGHPNAEGWARVVPYIHGWLVQTGAFEHGDVGFTDWQTYWGDLRRRFQHGYAGWPTGSAWGPQTPILVIAAEYASYWVFWHGRSEEEARIWGDAAMAAGADGYLDGGTVDVPKRREP